MTALRITLRLRGGRHLDAGDHDGGPPFDRRARETQFEARRFTVTDRRQFDFESRGGGRTFAMAANRLIDREVDARNPRTAQRELVTGAVSPAAASAEPSPGPAG